MKIIYQTSAGLFVITPTPEALALYGIHAIARKDVPAGLPYKIVEDAALPSDRSMRHAWRIDPITLTDGVGADSNQIEVTP